MERHSRMLAGGCLAALLGMVITSSGCRSMRNDVPPGKPYSTTGGGPPPVGFNSDPHPNTSVGSGAYGNPNPLVPGSGATDGPSGAGATTFGTPTGGGNPYGAPTSNRYGSLPNPVSPAPLNQ
jgi:hypothetical protein